MALSCRSAAMFLAFCGLSAQPVQAEIRSYHGQFAQDDQIDYIELPLTQPATILIRTFSYAGGVQADGRVVVPGGFDPNLALFDAAGHLLEENDDDLLGIVAIDPVTGEAYDSSIHAALSPGLYILAVTQSDSTYNFDDANALLAGPSEARQGNFTGPRYDCSNQSFCDFTHNNRTNVWALDIDIPAVPEPAVVAWLLVGLGALLHRARGRVTFRGTQPPSR